MDRRTFLSLAAAGTVGLPAALAQPAIAADAALNAASLGLVPGSTDDQSALLQAALQQASAEDRPLFLPPGRYVVANIALPTRARLVGIRGATHLLYGGSGGFFFGQGLDLAQMAGIIFDDGGRPLPGDAPGLVYLAGIAAVHIEGCAFRGGSTAALAMDECGGRIAGNDVTGAGEGIRAIGSTGLAITGNTVTDCSNNGILVFRWEEGEDGTIVTGNRVERIAAAAGGTGENGNGINVFQAGSVTVSDNRIADCAFTAVRANTADNVIIAGNNCSRLGEVGLYAEFGFQGAVVANNIVDTAAVGISIANFNDGGRIATVMGNVIRNLSTTGPYPEDGAGFGIGIAAEADVAISTNVIDGAPKAGVWLGWGPFLRSASVASNIIRDTAIGVAVTVVEGAGSALIAANVISAVRQGAVVGMNYAEPATGDLVLGGADAFPQLRIEGNQVG
ncbi:MAG: TIGR03808 family TAT-translocated repetitive protein [Bauldia sp.]|nr:TIGR03808 family TAT-translocated repetitive protein [Bauldia sp.]